MSFYFALFVNDEEIAPNKSSHIQPHELLHKRNSPDSTFRLLVNFPRKDFLSPEYSRIAERREELSYLYVLLHCGEFPAK